MAKLAIETDDIGVIRISLDGDQVGLFRSIRLESRSDGPPTLAMEVIDFREGRETAEKIRDAIPFAQVNLVPVQ